MKAYRLTAWPDLGPQHRRTAYRRLLSDMSQRPLSLGELCARSGLPRQEVRSFLVNLTERGLLITHDAPRAGWPLSLRPLRDWWRRSLLLSPRRAGRA
jgi:predicted ArsR family transcriptional regulator